MEHQLCVLFICRYLFVGVFLWTAVFELIYEYCHGDDKSNKVNGRHIESREWTAYVNEVW